MSDALSSVAGSLLAQKGAAASLTYGLDYSPDMAAGDTIVASTWTSSSGITLTANQFGGTQVGITIGGGTAGTWYVVKNAATDNVGDVHTTIIRLYVETDPILIGAGLNLPFPSVMGALAAFRRDRLVTMAMNFFPDVTIDDSYILDKMVVATRTLERRLRTHFVPTEVLPNTASQAEIDGLVAAGEIVELEPAYDYDPNLFRGNSFGFMSTRQRPIIAIHDMRFTYPTSNTVFAIPPEWIRVDRKYGTINLLPVTTPSQLPLNAFLLSALGGGRVLPQFIELRYRTGLENAAQDWPDILDVILKATALGIVEDTFVPSSKSESTSADGLSQSASIGLKMQDYDDIIAKKTKVLQSALFGIRMGVL